MRSSLGYASVLSLALTVAGCAAEAPVEEEEVGQTADELSVPNVFGQRIAMARFYQHGRPAIPIAQMPAKVAQLASVRPSYVSGLVRLDVDDAVTAGHVAAYAAVRAAIPNVRVDVVLNAEHYQGPGGWDRLKKRITTVNDALRAAGQAPPDVVFFDFYSKGQMSVMEAAARWTHDQRPAQKIGGTFWATNGVPEGTDFLVLDDHDGLERMVHQSKQLRARYGTRYPILAHVENNPGQTKTGDDGRNLGLEWLRGDLDRKAFLRKQVDGQQRGGYLLMYPVHFPLSPQLDAWDPTSEPGYLELVKRTMK